MTVKQALSILKPAADGTLKEAYRAGAFRYHPDHGGDAEIMKLVNNAYELLKKSYWSAADRAAAENEIPLTEVLEKLWNQFKHLPGLEGEVCGSWLWITGETRAYRAALKAAGFKFAAKKGAWYYHEGGYRKRGKRTFSMNEIRGLWGSDGLDKGERYAVAH